MSTPQQPTTVVVGKAPAANTSTEHVVVEKAPAATGATEHVVAGNQPTSTTSATPTVVERVVEPAVVTPPQQKTAHKRWLFPLWIIQSAFFLWALVEAGKCVTAHRAARAAIGQLQTQPRAGNTVSSPDWDSNDTSSNSDWLSNDTSSNSDWLLNDTSSNSNWFLNDTTSNSDLWSAVTPSTDDHSRLGRGFDSGLATAMKEATQAANTTAIYVCGIMLALAVMSLALVLTEMLLRATKGLHPAYHFISAGLKTAMWLALFLFSVFMLAATPAMSAAMSAARKAATNAAVANGPTIVQRSTKDHEHLNNAANNVSVYPGSMLFPWLEFLFLLPCLLQMMYAAHALRRHINNKEYVRPDNEKGIVVEHATTTTNSAAPKK